MPIRFLLFFLIILIGFGLQAKSLPTILRGIDKSYAGRELSVFGKADLITGESIILDSDTVDAEGNFKLEFMIDNIQLIQMPLGIYECILYVEPGKTYQVVLPPFQPKTKGDIFNPYFNPVQLYLGVKNPDADDINIQLAAFNEKYHSYVDQHYYYIFKNPRKANVDSVINQIESHFDTVTNNYFYNYRKYKYAWLKYTTVMRDYRFIIREYFNNQPVLYHNTSYMDLFNQLFSNYLTFYMNTSEGIRIFSDIAYAKSPILVKQTFSNNMVLLNDTLQEMVLLKGLHDAFYSNDFPLQSMLITLDSVSISSPVQTHSEIAQHIKKKVLQARVGFDAPSFELKDTSGVIQSNRSFLSNYVYLNFISLESFACQQELELMKALHTKHKDDLKLVSISIDDDLDKVKAYFKKYNYNWTLLADDSKQSTAAKYKVKAYPTYYLINPEGKLTMSPAPGPGENFEWYFFNILLSKRKGQIR